MLLRMMCVVLTALVASGGLAYAQDDLEARRAAAIRYVQSPFMQDMLAALNSPASLQTILGATSAQWSNIPEHHREKITSIMNEEMETLVPVMNAAMVEAVAQTMTLEQIELLDAFYRLPEMRDLNARFNDMNRIMMQGIAPQMQAVQARMLERMRREVR